MPDFIGINAKRFSIDAHRANNEGVIAELTETGICSTEEATINLLKEGQGDPNKVFAVNAGIIGSFQFARKSRLSINPSGVIDGVLRANYSITWLIYGDDFKNILGGASGS